MPAGTIDGLYASSSFQTDIEALKTSHLGIGVEDRGVEIRITIPDSMRVGHEAHFAQVTESFLKYLRDRRALPACDQPNMLAKYYVTTMGTELSRKSPSSPAPRIAPR